MKSLYHLRVPSKHILKEYSKDCYYHIYNRGVEKRNIFLEPADYNVFIYNIRRYLEPGFKLIKRHPITNERMFVEPNHVIGQISLLSFCLMPNHFHFLIKLHNETGITSFMRKVCSNYTVYFNDKYDRVGSLFQGSFKGVRIISEEQFIHLSRYIHLNPKEILKGMDLCSYKHSSFYYICKDIQVEWLDLDLLLGDRKRLDYVDFVKASVSKDCNHGKEETIRNLLLE